ncbi:F120B protein, partial [Ifrita kowaldi]|nr:F120B protein [Ifrita kowaldi]
LLSDCCDFRRSAMGVRGLQGFVARVCPDACKTVDLREMAEKHRIDHPDAPPVIVVDAMSCVRRWYTPESWVCGGQWREYLAILEDFINAFMAAGIKLVFYFDGVVEEKKREEWIKRRMKNTEEIATLFRFIKTHRKQPGREMFVLPSALPTFTRFALKSLGQKTVCTLQEADFEVAAYGLQHNCIGILGQDSDYLIYNTCPYFSIENLHLDRLVTVMYSREVLCHVLGISLTHLPLFACLLGNDVVPESLLEGFWHKCLTTSTHRNKSYNRRTNILLSVANYISKIPCSYSSLKHLEEMLPLGSDKSLLYRGVNSYLLPGQQSPWIPPNVINCQMSSLQQQSALCQDKEIFQVTSALNPFSIQPVFVHRIAPTQVQDLVLGPVEIDEVCTGPPLKPVQIPLDGSLPSCMSMAPHRLVSPADLLREHSIPLSVTKVFLAGKPLIHCISALLIGTVHRKYHISAELVLIGNDPVTDCSFHLLSSQVCRYWNSAEMVSLVLVLVLVLASGPVTHSERVCDSCVDGRIQIVQTAQHTQGMQSRETSVPAHHMAQVLENLLLAKEQHIQSENYSVFNILSNGEIECSNSLEDDYDTEIPGQALIYRPARQHIYSILLESGKGGVYPLVKEWFVYFGNPLKQPELIQPVRPSVTGGTPNLKTLWLAKGPDVEKQRYSTFLACFYLQDEMEELQALEAPVAGFCCLLAYLMMQVSSLSLEDLNAFLALILCLKGKSAAQLTGLQLAQVDSRAVHLGAVLIRGLTTLLMANSACGSPFKMDDLMPWAVFDGKLFQEKYQQSHRGCSVEELLEGNVS